jgi:hypothetical protein
MKSELKEKFEKICSERKLICVMLFNKAVIINSKFGSNIAYDELEKVRKDEIEAISIEKNGLKIADIIEMKEFINEIFECICIARGQKNYW